MSSILHQPHDFFFRKSMSDPRVAKDFFLEHLPPALHKQIDWSQLKLQNVSFLDEHFKRSAADMLYQVTLKNGKHLYLYLLCEHTSEPDPLLAFRLVKYMIRIIEQHTEQYPQAPFPAVYPMALYTGKKPYTKTLDWYTLFGEQENFMRQVFNSSFQLINVSQIEDTELRQHLWAGAFELMFKYRLKQHLSQEIVDQIGTWLVELEKQGGYEYITLMLKYMLNCFDGARGKEFINRLRAHLTPQLETELMTIGEQLRQEGMKQGEYTLLQRQMQRKFDQIPQRYLDKLHQANSETLLRWSDAILDAQSLSDIFDDE